MFKRTYKQTIRELAKTKGNYHLYYNPIKESRNRVQVKCFGFYKLYSSRSKFEAAVRELTRRSGPWTCQRVARQRRRRQHLRAVRAGKQVFCITCFTALHI